MNFTIYMKILECFLQKIATGTSAACCLLHFSSFRQKSTYPLQGSKNMQGLSVGWAMLLLPPGYMAEHSSILSL